jgi:hypothetical protein
MLWIVHSTQLSKQEELKTEDQLLKLLKELIDQVLVLLCKILQTVHLTMEVIGLLMIATTLQSKHQKLLTQMTGTRHTGTTVLLVFILMPHMLFHKIAMSIKTMP